MARRKKGQKVDGWVILDKPVGITSTASVAAVKRVFDAQKAGHGGTLDPLATGILPIALGEATKTVPFVMDGEKTYRFTLKFGEARSTDDAEGEVTARSDHRPADAEIQAVLPKFQGEITQVPPAFSAIKVQGERAYDLAREGEVVELQPRTVLVHEIRLTERLDPDQAVIEVKCGKGTYMRALARDIAKELGSVGHVSALRRTRVGRFTESQAIPLDSLEALGHSAAVLERLLPIPTALDDIPAVAVTAGEAELIRTGRSISLGLARVAAIVTLRPSTVLCTNGDLAIALARIDRSGEGGELRPLRVFNL